MHVIVRREHLHSGAQLSLFEKAGGWRYQLFATDTLATGLGRPASELSQLASLKTQHHAHTRVKDAESRKKLHPQREKGRTPASAICPPRTTT
ncbi:MAG: hypothetical protein P8Z68_08565 [Kineosporiaceae bacterium]